MIGRHSNCGIKLSLQTVSKRHCLIERRNDGFYVSDLGSRNGTFINDRLIDENVGTLLRNGDIVRICDITIKFNSGQS